LPRAVTLYKSLIMTLDIKYCDITVVGLGYVGMPLAIALAKYFPVKGFDINQKRVSELSEGWDSNREIGQAQLRTSSCDFTDKVDDIKGSNIYIVTVPTPIDENNKPDLGAVSAATKMIGDVLKKGDIIVYESTVYPGVTEEICGDILEQGSSLKSGVDFFLGYSPERINPGDTEHTVENITKIVAGQNDEVADLLAEIYGSMNGGRIFKAKDIKTAEAAKAIENAQRDINIAFVNEITMLLNKVDVSAYDVLEAAGTKWNFLKFSPGLVGGHCIGVDPYYLAETATKVGHKSELILAGRKLNDDMGAYIAGRVDRYINRAKKTSNATDKTGANILVLGFTFKENINDIRNTKVIDLVNWLKEFGHEVDVHDPHAVVDDVKEFYGLDILSSMPSEAKYDCIVLTVPHQTYKDMGVGNLAQLLAGDNNSQAILYDIKGLWRKEKMPDNVLYKCL